MRSTLLLALLGALALIGCKESGPAELLAPTGLEMARNGHGPSTAATPERPFEMSGTIVADYSEGTCDVEVPTGDPDNPTMLVRAARLAPARGTASHMGRVTGEIWHEWCRFALREGVLPTIETGGPFEVSAANGDTMGGTWSGYAVLAGDQKGMFFLTGEVTGGTGRFDDATGEMDIWGWRNFEDPTAPRWFEAEGTIAY